MYVLIYSWCKGGLIIFEYVCEEEEEEREAGANVEPTVPDQVESRELSREEFRSYRSPVARCIYLAADRFEIGFATKEMFRGMAKPNEEDLLKVKRMCRFLRGLPRMVQKIPFSEEPPHAIRVYVDSDWAGCRQPVSRPVEESFASAMRR